MPEIKIEKVKGSSQLKIFVDGEHWADGYKDSRGSHGYYYTFQDHAWHRVKVEPGDRREWKVWSDKQVKRQSDQPSIVKPFFERLPIEIEAMIEKGVLRSPAKCRADAEASREKVRREMREGEARKEAAFVAKAEEVLAGINLLSRSHELVTRRIVEAMKWAQTQ